MGIFTRAVHECETRGMTRFVAYDEETGCICADTAVQLAAGTHQITDDGLVRVDISPDEDLFGTAYREITPLVWQEFGEGETLISVNDDFSPAQALAVLRELAASENVSA